MDVQTHTSNVSVDVSRRVKSEHSTKGGPKSWNTNKASRLPRKAVKLPPAFTREEFDDETIWTFANGQTISVPVIDPNDFVREGGMIDNDRAISLENWTHLHDTNPLPTPAQRAQGALNLDRLRLDLLASTEEGQILFLNPEVMIEKDLNAAGSYHMKSNAADGEKLDLPDGFASAESPITDGNGPALIRASALNYRMKHIKTNHYVNFGNLQTLGAFVGTRNFVGQEPEPEVVAAALLNTACDNTKAQEEPLASQAEELSEQQLPVEVSSTTIPSWDPFASDYFDDDDDEILRLEQERLEESILNQAPQCVTDAEGDIEMNDYVEPEAEVDVEHYKEPAAEVRVEHYEEPEPEVVTEAARFEELLEYDWYNAHLRAREAGLVRGCTATTPEEANYIIVAPEGPATELLMFSRDRDDDEYSTFKAIGARVEDGAVIMGTVTHDSIRRYVLLVNGAGHFRECFDIYEETSTWPLNVYDQPLTGSKAPWVPAGMVNRIKPDLAFRTSYPKGTRGRDKNEVLDKDLYRRSSKVRHFSKMRDIWTLEGGLIAEESWSEDNLSWWKADYDSRRFPKLQFATIGVTPEDPPEVEEGSEVEVVEIEKMPVRLFGYGDGATTTIKHNFGDFLVSGEDDLADESEPNTNDEADNEADMEADFALNQSLIEESIFIDDDKWLADAEEGITEDLAQATLDSSPFQEIPADEAQSFSNHEFENEDVDSELDDSENDLFQLENSDFGLDFTDEDSSVEETFPPEIMDFSRRIFSLDSKGYENCSDTQDTQDAQSSEQLHQVVWESNLLSEVSLYANTVSHKRTSSDLSDHTETTEDAASASSPPTSDDGREESEKEYTHEQEVELVEKAAAVPLPAASADENLIEKVAQFNKLLTEDVFTTKVYPIKAPLMPIKDTAVLEPGVIAICTVWMMADPFSFFTIAGVGLLAWASREFLHRI
ncbi:hypothetical protein BLS_000469 [Venturia inaequalis]|uniref:Uncharacterized protein n=1 Tax=Venturia inaequalis TaxID=5025 RepID=A0A8H3YJT7_VENIN|nr:hypothetical protein BLS_000469 [Venturia inaequalis]